MSSALSGDLSDLILIHRLLGIVTRQRPEREGKIIPCHTLSLGFTHLCSDCMERPAMALTVSDSSCSMLSASSADRPTVRSSRRTQGQ